MLISALTHITQICHDFDVTNLLRYHDDNTLPHIAHFRGKIQETLCKSREAVLQNQGGDCFFITICNCSINFIKYTLLATDNRHFSF